MEIHSGDNKESALSYRLLATLPCEAERVGYHSDNNPNATQHV